MRERKLYDMKKGRVEANGISLGRYDFSWDNEGLIEQMTGRIYAGQYASRLLPLIGKTVKLVGSLRSKSNGCNKTVSVIRLFIRRSLHGNFPW